VKLEIEAVEYDACLNLRTTLVVVIRLLVKDLKDINLYGKIVLSSSLNITPF